jgi:integrase
VVPLWLAERLAGLDGTERPGSVRESLRRAGRRVGIDLNPHQLRHYYATTLLERGVPLVVVSRQLRHSDIATTLRTYAQANDGVEVHRALG